MGNQFEDAAFEVGDLIITVNSQTGGIENGWCGLITKIEAITRTHFIYWVRFGHIENEIPMWKEEMKMTESK